MPACKECGTDVALDENFCGGCGARVEADDPSIESAAAGTGLSKDPLVGSNTWGPPKDEAQAATGEVEEPSPGATSRAADQPPRRA